MKTAPSPTHVKTDTVTITPALALEWLKLNHNNRPMSSHKVSRMAKKMADGRWILTHQGIGFASDSKGNATRLLDGQHRLAAIAQAGVDIPLLVTYGLSEDAFDHIDTGGTRTAADLLANRLPEAKNRTALCAAARFCMLGLAGGGGGSKEDIVDFAEWYCDVLQNVVSQVKKLPGKLGASPVAAAFVNCVRGEDEWAGPKGRRDSELIVPLLERYVTMTWNNAADPMKALYTRLLRYSTSDRVGQALSDHDAYGLAVSAIRAGLNEQTLQPRNLQCATIDWGDAGDNGQVPRKKKG